MTDHRSSSPPFATLHGTETLGDRVMKVNHSGEHGAVCIYQTQRWIARWRAPDLIDELDEFITHERMHRALFAQQLAARNRSRCRSFHLCGIGGAVLGFITGIIGHRAIVATTIAIERVVLEHLASQLAALKGRDDEAVTTIAMILADEQDHLDRSVSRNPNPGFLERCIDKIVSAATSMVIWLGMRL